MPRITEMYAFVAAGKDPLDEGVCAFKLKTGEWMPLVAADTARVGSLRLIAQQIATISGKPLKLLRFSVREEVETIIPQETQGHA